MPARVRGQLGMESRAKQLPLTNSDCDCADLRVCNCFPVWNNIFSQNLDSGAVRQDGRGADEHGTKRLGACQPAKLRVSVQKLNMHVPKLRTRSPPETMRAQASASQSCRSGCRKSCG